MEQLRIASERFARSELTVDAEKFDAKIRWIVKNKASRSCQS